MILELTERLLTIFVAAAQKVFPLLKIEADPQQGQKLTVTIANGSTSMSDDVLEVGLVFTAQDDSSC